MQGRCCTIQLFPGTCKPAAPGGIQAQGLLQVLSSGIIHEGTSGNSGMLGIKPTSEMCKANKILPTVLYCLGSAVQAIIDSSELSLY